MIHEISFSNFYSFKNEVKINFVVDKNSPDTDAYHTDVHGTRVSKLMTVVGANASGKTNLLRSLYFLKWFITNSFSELGPDDKIDRHFNHFLFCSTRDRSKFGLVFEIEEDIYEYKLELTLDTVFSEGLYLKNRDTNRFNIVFERKCDESSKTCLNNFAKFGVTSDFEQILRMNSSVISTAKQIKNPIAIKIVDYFSKIQSNFQVADNHRRRLVNPIYDAAEFFHKKPLLKEKAEKIIQRFDLGISKFSLNELTLNSGEKFYVPRAHHRHNDNEGEDVLIQLHAESGGTKNLFVLLKDILAALDTGSMVIFDELDNNLHPLMIPELTNLFTSKKHNPKNAQLLFSTHNAQILSELDKTQIVFVEKDDKNISSAWHLSDMEGVRTSENYVSKYLSGVYGAIPKF